MPEIRRDNEIVEKVKQLKLHFESKKKKVEKMKKNDAMNQLKIEILVQRIKDIEQKKLEYQEEFKEVKKQTKLLAQQKATLETHNDELGEMLDKNGITRPHDGNLQIGDLNQILERKRLQEREKAQ